MRQKMIKNAAAQLKKGIVQMLGANVLNKMIAMLSNMVITRTLSAAEYGLWSYVLNIYSYLTLITGLGLLSGAFQFGAENRGTDKEYQYYKFCLKTGLAIDTVLVGTVMLLTFIIPFSLPGAGVYLRLLAPLLLLEYALNLSLTVLRCENRIGEYARILNINTFLSAAGTCIGAFFGIYGVIVGRLLANCLSLLQTLYKTRPEFGRIISAESLPWRKTGALWHYSLFVGASAALNMLLYLIDVTMVAAMIQDATEVAYYKVATLIPTALGFIPGSVITAVLPDIVKNNRNQKWLKSHVKKIMLGLGSFNFVLCLSLFAAAPLIISILSGTQYLGAVPAFRILICEYFLVGTFRTISCNILAALRCVNYGLFLSAVSGVADILLNFFLIGKLGMIGAACATFGTALIASALAFGYLLKKLNERREIL